MPGVSESLIKKIKVNEAIKADTVVSASYAESSSYAVTASYALNSGASSGNFSGSFTGSLTGSLLGTASWAQNALTASFVTASNVYGPYGSNSIRSASFALTASFITASNVYGPYGSNSILSSSYALTASFALNGGSPLTASSPDKAIQFNSASVFSGSANFTFDYTINRVDLTGSLLVTGSVTSSKALISSSGTQQLLIIGSGSSDPLVTVLGSQGYLVDIVDNLTGSLFSVSDISGFTVFEVVADRNTYIGDSQAPGLHTSKLFVPNTAGPFKMYATPTSDYNGMFVEYTAISASNARAGSIMSIRSGSSVNYTETTTTDFGNTSDLNFLIAVSASLLVLSGSVSTANWNIRSIIRAIWLI